MSTLTRLACCHFDLYENLAQFRDSMDPRTSKILTEAASERLEQSDVFISEILSVRIIFTNASPVKLAVECLSTPVESPDHIFCNVDNLYLQSLLLISVNVGPKVEHLKSLTLLVPVKFKRQMGRFVKTVKSALGYEVCATQVTSYETTGGRRHLITFQKRPFSDFQLSCDEELSMHGRVDSAFDFVTANFTNKVGNLGDGTDALPRDIIKKLASSMRIGPGDSFWEIGCGCPKVAFAFSAAASGGMVIATDKTNVFFTIQANLDDFVASTQTILEVESGPHIVVK